MITLRQIIQDCAKRNPDCDPEVAKGEDRAALIRTHTLALIAEAVEVLQEAHWKTWGAIDRRGTYKNNERTRAEELVDVILFWGNLVTLLDVHPLVLEQVYHQKSAEVSRRLAEGSGYVG